MTFGDRSFCQYSLMSFYKSLSMPCYSMMRPLGFRLQTCAGGGYTSSLSFRRLTPIIRMLRQFGTEPKNVAPVSEMTRMIPKDESEAALLKNENFPTPLNPRILTATILGMPNAGKSTLTNALMGWRVCSVSKKVHTTLRNIKAVLIENDAQIVLLDTPGIVSRSEKKRHNLEARMLTDPGGSISSSDLIIVLVDISNVWHQMRLDRKLLTLLEQYANKPSILVLNKIDLLVDKRQLLDIMRKLTNGIVGDKLIYERLKKQEKPDFEKFLSKVEKKPKDDDPPPPPLPPPSESEELEHEDEVEKYKKIGWPHFKRVFMISAKEQDGVETLKDYLFSQTKRGAWHCKPHMVTNQTPQEIAKMAVREKLLDHLQQEIPYNIVLSIEMWDTDEHGTLRIAMTLHSPLERQVKLIIGSGGMIVSRIADEARQELMNTFRCEVSLKLIVKSTKTKK